MMCALFASFCLFTPPDNWELSDPQTPSKHAICGFIDKKVSGFCPSIHLTHEVISCNIEEYLEIVYQNAKAKKQKWRKMGTIETQSGPARLVQIELNNSLGKVSLLQAILPYGNDVHILTAGALKKDLSKCASLFHEAFTSMHVIEDLFSLAKDASSLQTCWQKRDEGLESFHKAVLQENDLGPVFQIQLMRLK